MMDIPQILGGLASGSTISALLTYLLLRRKLGAESDIKIGELARALADDLREQLNEAQQRCDTLQAENDSLKRENLEWRSRLQRKEIQTEIHLEAVERKLRKDSDTK